MVAAAPSRIIITSGRRDLKVILGDCWAYRDLLFFLVWRDLKVRYKQTALGASWAILQPLVAMLVFTVIFGRFVGVPSNGLPYAVFSYAGLLPWTLFSQGVTQASTSLLGSAELVRKVYFPRFFLPLSVVAAGIVDVVVATPVLFLLAGFYGIGIEGSVVLAPIFLFLAVAACLGIGLWLSAITVRYRDFRFVVPFMVQIWLFLTPVIYPATLVTERFKSTGLPLWMYGVNPMAGAVEGFRWALVGGSQPDPVLLTVSALVAVTLLVSGWLVFLRLERAMADVV